LEHLCWSFMAQIKIMFAAGLSVVFIFVNDHHLDFLHWIGTKLKETTNGISQSIIWYSSCVETIWWSFTVFYCNCGIKLPERSFVEYHFWCFADQKAAMTELDGMAALQNVMVMIFFHSMVERLSLWFLIMTNCYWKFV